MEKQGSEKQKLREKVLVILLFLKTWYNKFGTEKKTYLAKRF
jgi:hypothetical protein